MQVILLFLVLSLSNSVFAEQESVRRYELRDGNSIQLKTPVSWKSELKDGPRLPYATIAFRPLAGPAFEILISPIVFSGSEVKSLSATDIRRRVLAGLEVVKSQAVESEVEVKELKGAAGPGYYYTVTDRAPKAGEYKYLTSGIVRVGNLAVSFTVLTNDGQQNFIDEALAVLRSAAHYRQGQETGRSAALHASCLGEKIRTNKGDADE